MGNLNDTFNELNLEEINPKDLPPLEQYMLHKLFVLNEDFMKNFKSYNFHSIYKSLLNFCTVDLSSFYFDIRKDTLYCDKKESSKRKNCIFVLNIILDCLLKWFAPILSFTSEEIFKLLNGENKGSIHLKYFPKINKNWENTKVEKDWNDLINIRNVVNSSIEKKREDKTIGSSLEAKITIKLGKKYFDLANTHDFAEICITSDAIIVLQNELKDEILVETTKAEGNKCPICWKISKNKCIRHGNLKS